MLIMETIYLCIVVFLLCLAVFDLFVGVSNDAVNFLQSAVGARAAKYRTVLIIASIGVISGAVMSSGMMDVARHNIMMPDHYSFEEVMTIFLAVMTTDVLILDVFNTLGLPTSTTVSLVFELLGGAFILATLKMAADSSLDYSVLLNSSQALKTIIAIFISVALAFFFGYIIMWISRIVFTFDYSKHSRWSIAVFGGIAFTALAYFIFLKGLGKSPYIPENTREWIENNTQRLMGYTFLISTAFVEILYLVKVNIFKFVVLVGTFALAMSFAGNDLVNFIGVPLAGLDSYQDYIANAHGAAPSAFTMDSLMASAKTPPLYLVVAGVIMIMVMATSKKARNVIKTSVDLSRQDEGEEMFGSSRAARAIVRWSQSTANYFGSFVPSSIRHWVDNRFEKNIVVLDDMAAFDVVRAAVTLVVSSMLITFGTNSGLPLSTTYVTFMVAIGASLADRAWSRESAVFRVTGVLSVVGGWFITAGVAFISCAIICLIMFYGGIFVKAIFIVIIVVSLIRSNRKYIKRVQQDKKETDSFQLMLRIHDPELVWDMLRKHVSRTQSYVNRFALAEFNKIICGLRDENAKELRHADKELRSEQAVLKKLRRQEMLGLKKIPHDIAIERNTWFHLGANSNQQYIYSLRRMLEPVKEHVDNNFNPLPEHLASEFTSVSQKVNDLMKMADEQIETGRYEDYRETLSEADACKAELSVIRKRHIDRIQESDNSNLQINLVYLNVLQETQEFLSVMRHQLRAAKKFMEN